MPISLEQLSEDDLFFILNCDKLSEIKQKFNEQEFLNLLDYAKNYQAIIDYANFKISLSLASALSDAPSYPSTILWAIIGTVTLGFFPLAIMTIAFFSAVTLYGIVYYLSSYQALKRDDEKNKDFFHLAALQHACADTLKASLEQQCESKKIPRPANHPVHLIEKKRHRTLDKIKKSFGTTLLVGSVLFGTYYVGASQIITALGVTTATTFMLGPLGVALSLILSLIVGCYFGYMCYQSCNKIDTLRKKKKEIISSLNAKYNDCYRLKDKLQQQATRKILATSINKPINKIRPTLKKSSKTIPETAIGVTTTYAKHPMILVNKLCHRLIAAHKPIFKKHPKRRFSSPLRISP